MSFNHNNYGAYMCSDSFDSFQLVLLYVEAVYSP